MLVSQINFTVLYKMSGAALPAFLSFITLGIEKLSHFQCEFIRNVDAVKDKCRLLFSPAARFLMIAARQPATLGQ